MDAESDKNRERELYGVSNEMDGVVLCAAVLTLVDHIYVQRTTTDSSILIQVRLKLLLYSRYY